MPAETFPCVICGRVLIRELDEYEAQPRDGVMCQTSGNYGSRVYDSMDLSHVAFNICDPCFTEAGRRGRLWSTRSWMPVIMPVFGQVGRTRANRPYVLWHDKLTEDGAMLYITDMDELEELVVSGGVELHGGLTVAGLRESLDAWEDAQEARD